MSGTSAAQADWVGWLSTAILIATVGRQAFTQWRESTTAGMSHWFFIGQFAASSGFVIYSALLGNVVFIVSNVFLLFIAVFGQVMYLRNRRRETALEGAA